MKPSTTIVYLIVTAVAIASFFIYNKHLFYDNTGTVVILNGPSGSGKSTIQKEFQKLMMPQLWLKLNIDNLFDAPMPDITPENIEYWQSPNSIRWVASTNDKDGNKIVTLHVGEEGKKVAYAMNSAIADYAKNGCNVIVDYIAYKKEWLDDLQQKLLGMKAYFVAVEIPLETLEEREAARGTSPVGHARSHFATVYQDLDYNLVVNSERNSAQKIAQQIKELIEEK